MQISCKGWNSSKQEVRCQARCLALEHCKEPFNATDHAIDSVIEALRTDGCNPDIITTITLPLDEYRLLISDAQKKAKEEGREEAWDLARRIVTTGDGCYSIVEVNEAFGEMNILRTPVEEVLARDKEYREGKNTLHIGDEVEFGVLRGYIIEILLSGEVLVLTKIYGTFTVSCKNCKKTGKHSEEIERAMASFEKGESHDNS